MFGPSQQRKIAIEKEPKWDEPGDVDADVLPVVPVLPILIPGPFKELLM